MKTKSLLILVSSAMSILLVGCSSNNSSSNNLTGYLVDSAVSGVSYTTATISGTTDSSGAFNYASGETVTFSVGSITIGSIASIPTDGKVMPQDIAGIARTQQNTAVTNIAQLLQSLDDDANPANGISITEATRNSLNATFNIQSASSNEINSAVTAAGKTLVSSTAALAHLASTASSVTGSTINSFSTVATSSSSSSTAAVATAVSGIAIDGELSGSTVCLDTKLTGTCADETIKTTTAANGTYSLSVPLSIDETAYPLIVEGGFDTGANGAPFEGKIKGYASLKDGDDVILSPLTTLVAEKMKAGSAGGITDAEILAAKTAVATSLFGAGADPEKAISNPKDDAEVYKQAQKIQKTMETFRSMAKKVAGGKTDNQLMEEAFKAVSEVLTDANTPFEEQLGNMSDAFIVNLNAGGLTISDADKANMKTMTEDVVKPFAGMIASQTFDVTNADELKKAEASMFAFTEKFEMDFENKADLGELITSKDNFVGDMAQDMQDFKDVYDNAGADLNNLQPDQMAAMMITFGDNLDANTMTQMLGDPALLDSIGDLSDGFDDAALAAVKSSVETEMAAPTGGNTYDFISLNEFQALTATNLVPVELNTSGFAEAGAKKTMVKFSPMGFEGYMDFTFDGTAANVDITDYENNMDFFSEKFGQVANLDGTQTEGVTYSDDNLTMNIAGADRNLTILSYTTFGLGIDENITTEPISGFSVPMPTTAVKYLVKVVNNSNIVEEEELIGSHDFPTPTDYASLAAVKSAYAKNEPKFMWFGFQFEGTDTEGNLVFKNSTGGFDVIGSYSTENIVANFNSVDDNKSVMKLLFSKPAEVENVDTSTIVYDESTNLENKDDPFDEGIIPLLYVDGGKVYGGSYIKAGTSEIAKFYNAAAFNTLTSYFGMPPQGLDINSVTATNHAFDGTYNSDEIKIQLKDSTDLMTVPEEVNTTSMKVMLMHLADISTYNADKNLSNMWMPAQFASMLSTQEFSTEYVMPDFTSLTEDSGTDSMKFNFTPGMAGKYMLDVFYDKAGNGAMARAGVKVFDIANPQFTADEVNSTLIERYSDSGGDGYIFLGDGRVVFVNSDATNGYTNIQEDQAPILRTDGGEEYNAFALWSVADGNITFDLNNTTVNKQIQAWEDNSTHKAVSYFGRSDYAKATDTNIMNYMSVVSIKKLQSISTSTILADSNISIYYDDAERNVKEEYTLDGNGNANVSYSFDNSYDGSYVTSVGTSKYRIIDNNASIVFYDFSGEANSTMSSLRDGVATEIVNFDAVDGTVGTGMIFHYYGVTDANVSNYKDLNDTDGWSGNVDISLSI